MFLHRLISDIEILSPFVMGIADVTSEYPNLQGLLLEVPSVPFDPGTDLYGCVSDVTI